MLPVLTTIDDVRSIVRYLKNKPMGATAAEAKAALSSQVLDKRKISAYLFWRIVLREGDRLKLAPLGWELARKPETEADVFRSVLSSVVPYQSALEWVHHQHFDAVTNNDVAAHWHEHHAESLGDSGETTVKDGAICFFHLCQAARFGKLVVGRRGQPTRLEVNQNELAAYIESGPSSPPLQETTTTEADRSAAIIDSATSELLQPKLGEPVGPVVAQVAASATSSHEELRVFITHGKNMQIVEQVQTMLGLASIESEVAEEEESPAIPVPDKVFGAMKRCRAGVIVVSVEEGRKDSSGKYALNENVLIEIGAAYVLYDRRLILLWDKRLPVPSNLQGLYRCEFEGSELSWTTGMKFMKGIQSFKTI